MIKKLNYIFSKRDKAIIFILLIAVVAGSFLELAAVSVFSPFIDLIMKPDSISQSNTMSFIYQLLGIENINNFLTVIAAGIIVIYVIKDLYTIVEKIIIAHRLTTIKNADVVYEVGEGKVQKKDKKEIIS